MKDKRKTEIKVGITVLVGALIFLWILGWAKNVSLTSGERTLVIKFENVSGLEIGDDVTINGVRMGHVNSFDIKDEYVLVKISIDNSIQLKKDAAFTLTMLDLMGGKKIDIRPGTASEQLDYDKVQSGTFSSDISEVISMVGKMEHDLLPLIGEAHKTLATLNLYLEDEKFMNDIKTSVAHLNTISQNIDMMINENKDDVSRLTKNGAELTEELNAFIKDNKSDIETSVRKLKTIMVKTDSLMISARKFADNINREDNTLNRFLNDKEMYNKLNNSLEQIHKIVNILIYQLKGEGVNVDANLDLF